MKRNRLNEEYIPGLSFLVMGMPISIAIGLYASPLAGAVGLLLAGFACWRLGTISLILKWFRQ